MKGFLLTSGNGVEVDSMSGLMDKEDVLAALASGLPDKVSTKDLALAIGAMPIPLDNIIDDWSQIHGPEYKERLTEQEKLLVWNLVCKELWGDSFVDQIIACIEVVVADVHCLSS